MELLGVAIIGAVFGLIGSVLTSWALDRKDSRRG